MFALKVGVAVALLVAIVLGVVVGVLEGDPVQRAVEGLLSFPGRAIMVFAWTTLGFAALDIAQSQLKMTHEWDPRSLPKVMRHEHRISRYGSLCEFFLILAYIVWLLLLPGRPHLLLGPAATVMEPATVWADVYPLIIALAVAGAALKGASYVRPYWTRRKALARIATSAATIVTFAVLLRAEQPFVLKSGVTWPGAASADAAIAAVNGACRMGLLIAGIITAFELLRELYRLNARRGATRSVDIAA